MPIAATALLSEEGKYNICPDVVDYGTQPNYQERANLSQTRWSWISTYKLPDTDLTGAGRRAGNCRYAAVGMHAAQVYSMLA